VLLHLVQLVERQLILVVELMNLVRIGVEEVVVRVRGGGVVRVRRRWLGLGGGGWG